MMYKASIWCILNVWPVLQVGFFKLIAIPMLAPFVLTFPGCQPLLDGLMANYAAWCNAEETSAHGRPLRLEPAALLWASCISISRCAQSKACPVCGPGQAENLRKQTSLG